jgi:heme/copper-type cytochrome/quinol oxidase subunit 4
MIDYLRTRTTVVWLLLVAATAVSLWMGHGMGFSDVRHAGLAILLVAFIKVRYVFLEFMEVRGAPSTLRRFVEGWVVCVCAALLLAYWMGANPASVASWPRVPGL